MKIIVYYSCSEDKTKCPPGCNSKGTYNGIPPEAPEAPETREHIETMLASTSRQTAMGLLNSAANSMLNDMKEYVINTTK